VPDRFQDGYQPYLLHRADSLLSADLHRELAEHELQVSEWRVLTMLRDRGALPIGTLADQTTLPQPPVTHAVARLERRGLVVRSSGRTDRRQRFVTTTDAGAALAAQLIERASALEERALAGLAEEERVHLASVLRALIGRLELRGSGREPGPAPS
jgi:DNA-binding MarR family transcriptional regulator